MHGTAPSGSGTEQWARIAVELRALAEAAGAEILTRPQLLQASMDDYMPEANPAYLQLVVDTVRLGLVDHVRSMVQAGGDSSNVISHAAVSLSQQRLCSLETATDCLYAVAHGARILSWDAVAAPETVGEPTTPPPPLPPPPRAATTAAAPGTVAPPDRPPFRRSPPRPRGRPAPRPRYRHRRSGSEPERVQVIRADRRPAAAVAGS